MQFLLVSMLSFIFICSELFGQNIIFGEKGGNWKYDVIHQTGLGIQEIILMNDTVIQGRKCQVLETKEHRFSYPNPPWGEVNYVGTYTIDTNITCVSGDTVFHYRDNSFYVLYNFGTKIGETWDLGYDSSVLGQTCTTSAVVVVDTGHIIHNGRNLRYLDLNMTDSNHSYNLEGRIYEKMGHEGFLFPRHGVICQDGVPEPSSFFLRCYGDSAFSTFSFAGPNDGYGIWSDTCEINFYVGEEEFITENNIVVFPNPFDNSILIEINTGILIDILELHDLTGKRINLEYEYHTDRIVLDTRNINRGLYFLSLKFTDGSSKTFKLMRE